MKEDFWWGWNKDFELCFGGIWFIFLIFVGEFWWKEFFGEVIVVFKILLLVCRDGLVCNCLLGIFIRILFKFFIVIFFCNCRLIGVFVRFFRCIFFFLVIFLFLVVIYFVENRNVVFGFWFGLFLLIMFGRLIDFKFNCELWIGKFIYFSFWIFIFGCFRFVLVCKIVIV